MSDVEIVLRRTATWDGIVRSVAREWGEEPDVDECGYILWNHTGYPSFWTGDPVECCIDQVRAYYEGAPSWWRYQARLKVWRKRRNRRNRGRAL